MASYAKQSEDETLLKMARRIQARAIERCGELLREWPAAPGARTDLEPHTGDDTRLTRTDMATAAGLSKRQKDTAIQVSGVPRDEFEDLVESDNPPTVTELAERGTQRRQPEHGTAGGPLYSRAGSRQRGTIRASTHRVLR